MLSASRVRPPLWQVDARSKDRKRSHGEVDVLGGTKRGVRFDPWEPGWPRPQTEGSVPSPFSLPPGQGPHPHPPAKGCVVQQLQSPWGKGQCHRLKTDLCALIRVPVSSPTAQAPFHLLSLPTWLSSSAGAAAYFLGLVPGT